MQKKISIKNIILKSITWFAAIVFLLTAMACDDMEASLAGSIMFGCIAWFGLMGAANNWGWN